MQQTEDRTAIALTLTSRLIHKLQRTSNIGSVDIHDLSVGDHLIENEVGAVQIVHNLGVRSKRDIELANISKNGVQRLNVAVDELKNGHFVLRVTETLGTHVIAIDIKTCNEIQRGVASEDKLVLSELHHVALPITSPIRAPTFVSFTPRHLRTHSPSRRTRSFISRNS